MPSPKTKHRSRKGTPRRQSRQPSSSPSVRRSFPRRPGGGRRCRGEATGKGLPGANICSAARRSKKNLGPTERGRLPRKDHSRNKLPPFLWQFISLQFLFPAPPGSEQRATALYGKFRRTGRMGRSSAHFFASRLLDRPTERSLLQHWHAVQHRLHYSLYPLDNS